MKKKKALMIVLAVLLLGLAGLVLSGCDGDKELAAPTGLEITNDVLTWKAVEGADGYTVEINGEEYKTQNNSLDLFEITNKYGTYEIRVAADSVTEGVLSSDWSEQTSLTLTMPDWFGFLPTDDGKGWETAVIDAAKAQGKLIIPSFFDGKAVVRAKGFNNCTGLTGVIFPDTVEYISGFENCQNLTRVRWSAGLKKIKLGAFDGTALETLVLPEGVEILENAFKNCTELKSVSLPSTLTKIGNSYGVPPFSGCHSLESIEIAEGNEVYASDGNCIMRKADNTLVLGLKASKIPSYTEHIGSHAFRDSGAESIALPEGVTSIGDYAFAHNDRLKEITLPQSLTSIGKAVFFWCTALGKIAIPDGVTELPYGLFAWCTELKEVALGAKTEKIDTSVFRLCGKLERITISESNAHFKSAADGRFLLNKTGDTLVLGCQDGAIPDGVKKIGERAFEGRTGLKEIDFNEVEEIGEYAFVMCAGLDRLKLTSAVRIIGEGAFQSCIGLSTVRIPDGVQSIGSAAFLCMTQKIALRESSMATMDGILRKTPLVLVVPESVEQFSIGGSYTVYTAYSSLPTGWSVYPGSVAVWGCELGYDDDGLPYVLSAPNTFSGDGMPDLWYTAIEGDGYLMHVRDGFRFAGWATEPNGEAAFLSFEKSFEFEPLGANEEEKFYLYKKTFYLSASMTEEQCKEAALSGAERLYAVWEKI